MSHGANYLKRFAKPKQMKKDKARSIRLPSEIADEFERHCARYDLSFNEGILRLILRELGKDQEVTLQQSATREIPTAHNVVKDEHKKEHERITIVSQPKPRRNTTVSRVSTGFSIKDFKIDGKVPCPICYGWHSYKNFSRHCKEVHGMETKEVIAGKREKLQELYEKARK